VEAVFLTLGILGGAEQKRRKGKEGGELHSNGKKGRTLWDRIRNFIIQCAGKVLSFKGEKELEGRTKGE